MLATLHRNVNRFFLVFVIMQVLSASAVWISGGLEIFNLWLRMGLVYFLITQSVDNEAKVKGIAATIVLAVVYLSYYSISSFVVGYLPGVRAAGFGWYENPNDIAIAIPLALLVANTAKAMPTRILFMAIAAMFAFNIMFTGSRNGMLGLLAVGALSIYFSERVPKPKKVSTVEDYTIIFGC